ncbi:MAG: DNA primase [Gammaproteobacteria bacterium]|nr:DNA primase [Gammaproteobacteria bacterium]
MNGLIPREFIDELLTRTDLVELVDAYVPLKKRGINHIACCPFHQEKTPSFNVIPKKQFYHCFGCGANGNAISFIMSYLHQTFPQAIETLAAKAGMQIPREQLPENLKQALALYGVLKKASDYYQKTLRKAGKVAIDYLKQRGVNGEVARRYHIGYAPPGWHALEEQFPKLRTELLATGMLIQKENQQQTYDRYRQRIMFPIHDRHGRITGFGGRAIESDQQPKYLNSPETVLFQKGRELYGLYQILQQQTALPSIVIVEGYLDVIALAQHGVNYAVATLGTTTSAYHVQLLSKYTQDLRFCFDGDTAGRQAAWRALENSLAYLDSGLQAHFAFLPDGQDPDSFIRAEGQAAFETYLKTAIPLSQLFFETLLKDIDITDLAGKSRLIHAAKPYLFKMNDGPYKTLLLDELARITRLDSHRVEQLLNTHSSPPNTENTPATPTPLQRTPLRIALALLIQNPKLYPGPALNLGHATTTDPEYLIFDTILTHLAERPQLNTATLIEHFRESPWFDVVSQLASWDHQVPEHAQASEFSGAIASMHKKNQALAVQQLIEKSKQQRLTDAERQQLQQMLQARHNQSSSQTE